MSAWWDGGHRPVQPFMVHGIWHRLQSGRPLVIPSLVTVGQVIGNSIGGTLVSAAWGLIIGAFVVGIVGGPSGSQGQPTGAVTDSARRVSRKR
jgi:hypothetical protein